MSMFDRMREVVERTGARKKTKKGKAGDGKEKAVAAFKDAMATLSDYLPQRFRDEPGRLERELRAHLIMAHPVTAGELEAAYYRLCEDCGETPQAAGEYLSDEVQRALRTAADLWEHVAASGMPGSATRE